MANPDHIAVLNQGVEAWNRWRSEHDRIRPDLRDADLRDRLLDGIDLRYASLHTAACDGVSVIGADLSNANLTGATLRRARLRQANFGGADLYKAVLDEADLTDARLVAVNLNRASLADCTAQVANLSDADCLGAAFQRANLKSAYLLGANLSRANLTEADLRGAELSRAHLLGTVLFKTNFAGAIVGWTTFGGTDLGAASGLDDVAHEGPSTIGIDVLTSSHGRIPEGFLRGAGLSDETIRFAHSLGSAAAPFHSCFISYSTKDQPFADLLYSDLQAKGVRCWFAPHDIQGGRKVHEQIDEAIRIYDKLLLVLSDASMNSPWVKTEIANARAREVRQKRQMLFPITVVPYERVQGWKLFDADTGIDSAREIREYFVPDFSKWKDHDAYAKAFERLVRDLKAATGEDAGAKNLG